MEWRVSIDSEGRELFHTGNGECNLQKRTLRKIGFLTRRVVGGTYTTKLQASKGRSRSADGYSTICTFSISQLGCELALQNGERGGGVMRLRFKKIMRYDAQVKIFRAGRIMWERGTVGDGNGYSAKLSLSFTPTVFAWQRECGGGWLLIIAGIRVHYRRAYGGIYV
jgi:hypothetical protein